MWLNGNFLSDIISTGILNAKHVAASPHSGVIVIFICRCYMKITIVCGAPGGRKGSELAAVGLIEGMRSRGHEVTAVCSEADKADIEGCIVLSGRGILSPGCEIRDVSALSESVNSSLELMIADSDVVHIMAPTVIGRAALDYCRRYGIPVTVGFYAEGTSSDSRVSAGNLRIANRIVYRMRYNSFYRYADAVLYPSQPCRRLLENAASAGTNGFVLPDIPSPGEAGQGVFSLPDSADVFENMLYSVR